MVGTALGRKAASRVRAVAEDVGFGVGLLWRSAPWAAVVVLLFGVAGGIATPLLVWAMGGLINAVTVLPADPWPTTWPWLAALFVSFALRANSQSVQNYMGAVMRERVNAATHRLFFEQAIAVPLAMYERLEYYTRLDTGLAALNNPVVDSLWDVTLLIGNVVGALGLLILIARANVALGVVLLAAAVAHWWIGTRVNRNVIKTSYEKSPVKREAAYWSGQLSSREAAAERRLFGLSDLLFARWSDVFGRYLGEVTAARRGAFIQTMVSAALREAAILVGVLALLLFALQGQITLGTLVALLYALSRYRGIVSAIGASLQTLVGRWAPVGYLRQFLALPPDLPAAHPHRVPPRPMVEGVSFHDVGFTYPGAERPALSGVTLLLRPGERIALVGENGAGKTTLVRLLLGLYRPTSGRITVDGVDLAELDPERWRREATAIFQDFVRYDTNVVENVAYADIAVLPDGDGEHPAHPRVVTATRQSGAAEFIANLPAGYATPLGKQFEGAVDLSSGQWQRLAIARAYLRDAQIVVLDEPTAALDPRGEVEVYRQFGEAAAGRCAVFISHRLGSARLAQRIVVLRQGHVVEQGDHNTLLAANGEYAQMYRLQANWYADGMRG